MDIKRGLELCAAILRHAVAACGLIAAACAAAVEGPGPVTAVRLPVPDSESAGAAPGAPRPLAVFEIKGDGAMGGFSGLHIEAERALLLSDRGFVATAALAFTGDRRLAAVTGFSRARLCGLDGAPLTKRPADADAEALRRLPDRSWLVRFEPDHLIWRYSARGLLGRGAAQPYPAPLPAGLGGVGGNKGVEAMTPLAGGGLLAIAEGRAAGLHPAWLWRRDDGWRRLPYRGIDGFAPTDAVALPDGSVIVLERFYLPIIGPDARLVRLPAAALRDDGAAMLEGTELLRFSAAGLPLDNYEGLAFVPREAASEGGDLFVISDDNFRAAQRTLLIQFRLRRPNAQ